MGKGKKKFIDKNEGQTFHLLHRSQRDEAYANDERPSDFVLVPASGGEFKSSVLSDVFKDNTNDNVKDHINPLGFKNDGYDYEQHLKVIGGGKFMGKDGHFIERNPVGINLPDDVFASEHELERNFQAITLSPEFMDDDIRLGLFEDGDEEGEFEELDDDFILQIGSEPVVSDFDFDAHMAKLLELSERSVKGQLGNNSARGWDKVSDTTPKGHFLKRKNKISNKFDSVHDFLDENDELVDEDGDSDNDDDIDDDDEENDEEDDDNNEIENDEVVDEEFDKILDEYEDDQLGYISNGDDDDEEQLQGVIDIHDENNDIFNNALQEFLTEHKDTQLYDGSNFEDAQKMKQEIANFRSHIDDKDNEMESINKSKIDYKKEYLEQIQYQNESAEMFPEYVSDIRKALTVFHEENEIEREKGTELYFQSQEYLKHERVSEQWDCETVLSTYSTLDNHPTVIKDLKSKFKPYIPKHERKQALSSSATATASASVTGDDKSVAADTMSLHSKYTTNTHNTHNTSSALSQQLKQKHRLRTEMSNNFISIRDAAATASLQLKPTAVNPSPPTPTPASIAHTHTQAHTVSSSTPAINHANTIANVTPTIESTKKLLNKLPPVKEEVSATNVNSSSDLSHDAINNDNNNNDECVSSEDEDDMSNDDETKTEKTSRKNETKEEKKQRKQRVKEERRLKRQNKKVVKEAFKTEQIKYNKPNSLSTVENLSIYKY